MIGLEFQTLRRGYLDGSLTPTALIERVIAARAEADPAIWIHQVPSEALRAAAAKLEAVGAKGKPLYGLPFAVKDNIDVAGLPTTAACPDFSSIAERSATVVEKLVAAGALLIGKTNLDQFATGLVGVRSPYGVPRNPFDGAYVPGGSSSGSAVAVSVGLVSFALGTDTAGSGRVPAGFNNIVGLKPTRGLVSAAGVVPACRSLDCVSIFALTVEDAASVLEVAGGEDPADPFSRAAPWGFSALPNAPSPAFRFGLPRPADLKFFGNGDAERLFGEAVERMTRLGGLAVEIDYQPFAAAASLLYGGPWVAERRIAVGKLLDEKPESIHPVVRRIVAGGDGFSAVDTFQSLYRLEELRALTRNVWREIDFLLLPTSGTIYRLDEVERDPVTLNSNLGYYTNFVNLMDLSALAVPSGFQANGLPAGVTLVAPAFHEARIAGIAAAYHRATSLPLGATGAAQPEPSKASTLTGPYLPMAVVGAHLSGEPRNHELLSLGGRLRHAGRTAAAYRLFALPDGLRPGLLRVAAGGKAMEVEVWDVPMAKVGPFLATIAPPLGFGAVELEDGSLVRGFLCEAHGIMDATDITEFGGWRAYRRKTRAPQG